MRFFSIFLFCLFWSTCSPAKHTLLSKMADVGQIANPVIGLGLAVIKEDREGMFQWLYTTLLNSAVTVLIKVGVNHIDHGKHPLNRRPNGKHYNFPSGHTSAASAGANFVLFRYGIPYAVIPYIITGITAAGRVQARQHTPGAVFAGFAVGLASAFIFTKSFNDKDKDKNKKQSLTIMPVASKEFKGLSITYRF
jgi:membrane-associated phospholipid phosphatase